MQLDARDRVGCFLQSRDVVQLRAVVDGSAGMLFSRLDSIPQEAEDTLRLCSAPSGTCIPNRMRETGDNLPCMIDDVEFRALLALGAAGEAGEANRAKGLSGL